MSIAIYNRTSWREVAPEFAVGEVDGNFAGTVERVGERYVATNGLGERVGAYRSVETAQRALERAADLDGGRGYGRRDVAIAKIVAAAASVTALAATAASLAMLL